MKSKMCGKAICSCPESHNRKCTFSYTMKMWLMGGVCISLILSAATLLYFLLAKGDTTMSPKRLLLDGQDFVAECPTEYVQLDERFDCYPEEPYVSRSLCEARGCCFLDNYVKEIPSIDTLTRCVYPQNYGYTIREQTTMNNGFQLSLQRLSTPSRYGDDIQVAHVLVERQTPYRLRIKFYDPISDHYEVPTPKISVSSTPNHQKEALYSVRYNNASEVPFSIQVQRQVSRTTLFDTSLSGITLSHHFMELTTKLPSKKFFGFGQSRIKESTENKSLKSWPLFADPILKGVHPMYIVVEDDGKAHGVLLLNSNAMEVKLMQTPAITFRTIGGVLDFYLFLGPTPEDVVKQYTEAIGRPAMPPYWALGLHTGNEISDSIEALNHTLQNWVEKDIHMEVLHLNLDLGLDAQELRKFINFSHQVKNEKHKLMLSLTPYVKVDESRNSVYKKGMKQSAFIRDKYGSPFYGWIDPDKIVAYIDFGSLSGLKWWTEFLKIISVYVQFDGISMIDNSPLSDIGGGITGCMNGDLNRPPYVPNGLGRSLYSKTVCMDTIQHWNDQPYSHYYLHNLYGHITASMTQKALDNLQDKERKMLISQSTFSGSGVHAGHWVTDTTVTWGKLESLIQLIADYNLYGIPSVGIKICECCNDIIDDELLLRWIQLGTFFPISGIFDCSHETFWLNRLRSNEFYRAVKHSISLRYQLLPFLYTLHYEAHTQGKTVFKLLWHEFPEDNVVYNIKSQFMWGSSLLVSPVLIQGANRVQYYLPQGLWYDFYRGNSLISMGEWFNETLFLYDHPNLPIMHIRAGHILVLHHTDSTVVESRRNPMKLVVALNYDLTAEGILYLDDGSSKNSIASGDYALVKFTLENNILAINVSGKFNTVYIQHVKIMGLERNPRTITIGDSFVVTAKQKHWNSSSKVLDIKKVLIPVEGKNWKIKL